MTGGSVTSPFHAALAELYDIHKQELDSQRANFEKRLKEVYEETEHYHSLLAMAQKRTAALDPFSSKKETEFATELHRTGAEAGGSIKCSVDLGPSPDTGSGGATGPQPGAAGSEALFTGTAVAMRQGTAPTAATPTGPRWLWEVTGGEDTGGIVVRDGEQTDSPQHTLRLATGSLVEETERNGDRLNFRRITAAGPMKGWISVRASGKDLAVPVDRPPLRPWQPPPVAVGPHSKTPLSSALVFSKVPWSTYALGMYRELPTVKEGMTMIERVLSTDGLMSRVNRAGWILPTLGSFIAGLATLEKLKSQRPEIVSRAGAVAGSGVGQYIALCAAGALSVEDGLNLAKLRLLAIQDASALCEQLTVAVDHIEQERLHSLCLQVRRMEGAGAVCQISAYFLKSYFWVSGTRKAMDLIEGMAREAGAKVHRLWPLAPHTPLMTPALAEFTAALDEVLPRTKTPLYTVWMNATAEPIRPGADPADVVADLKHELSSPMLVTQSVDAMRKERIGECYHVQLTTDRFEPVRPITMAIWVDPVSAQASKGAGEA